MGHKRQPVFVLSLPRSGSSWVGLMLGSAPNARYLREPFTQGNAAIRSRIVFEPASDPLLEPIMLELAEKTLSRIPDFEPKILQCPEQWTAENSRGRRLVIKEVNPRGCLWFIERYQPRVVFLVRHPAAVCYSSECQGWLGSTPDDWRHRGFEDSESLQIALTALKGYSDHQVVFYETLCERPVDEFRRLYDFAGLTWSTEVAEKVLRYSVESKERRDAWRRDADPERVAALRESFQSAGLEWYSGEASWTIQNVTTTSRTCRV